MTSVRTPGLWTVRTPGLWTIPPRASGLTSARASRPWTTHARASGLTSLRVSDPWMTPVRTSAQVPVEIPVPALAGVTPGSPPPPGRRPMASCRPSPPLTRRLRIPHRARGLTRRRVASHRELQPAALPKQTPWPVTRWRQPAVRWRQPVTRWRQPVARWKPASHQGMAPVRASSPTAARRVRRRARTCRPRMTAVRRAHRAWGRLRPRARVRCRCPGRGRSPWAGSPVGGCCGRSRWFCGVGGSARTPALAGPPVRLCRLRWKALRWKAVRCRSEVASRLRRVECPSRRLPPGRWPPPGQRETARHGREFPPGVRKLGTPLSGLRQRCPIPGTPWCPVPGVPWCPRFGGLGSAEGPLARSYEKSGGVRRRERPRTDPRHVRRGRVRTPHHVRPRTGHRRGRDGGGRP